jgi:N-acyl-D-aspartate/D-glutamate deacylase
VGSNWDNVLVVRVPPTSEKRFEGKSIAEIAKLRGVEVWDTFFDLVQMDGVDVDPKSMNEEQKHEALRANFVSIDSDAEPMNPAYSTFAHPRTFGTFPRILAKYVRQDQVITLENAVREMTSLPANQLHLRNRGKIGVGMEADVVLFDPSKVKDTATYEKPMSYAEGMEYVLVNGQLAIDHGQSTGALAGKLIRANR